jgi:hypothetical protein
MLFSAKALAVFFLAVSVSSQAFSSTGPLVAPPSDAHSLMIGSSLLEAESYPGVTGAGQMYGASKGALANGSLVNTGDSLNFPVFKGGQVFAEMRNGEIVISDATVPEPESYAMFLAGLGIIAAMVRRRSRSV